MQIVRGIIVDKRGVQINRRKETRNLVENLQKRKCEEGLY